MGCFRPPIQCLPRPLSWRLMWPGREVWLLHPHSSQSDTLWSYVSFPHVRIRWFLQNGTERKNPFFNLCGLSVAIIVDMASLTSDMLYLKSVLRLSCNFTFANSVTANLFFLLLLHYFWFWASSGSLCKLFCFYNQNFLFMK
jgi:hypothetical protein